MRTLRWSERIVRVGELVLAFVAATIGLALALTLIDRLLRLRESVRHGLLAVAGIILLAVLVRGLARQVLPNDASLALQLERRSGRDLRGYLLTAVEMDDPAKARTYGYSLPLVEACAREAMRRLAGFEPMRVVDRRKLARALTSVVCLVVAVAAVLALDGRAASYIFFTRYLGTPPPWTSPPRLEVSPGPTTVAVGDRLIVRLVVDGQAPLGVDPLLRRWDDRPDGVAVEAPMVMPEVAAGHHEALLLNLTHDFRYRVELGPYESPTFHVRVVARPVVAGMRIQYTYPRYTRLSDRVQDRAPYDIIGPVGTHVRLAVKPSKPVLKATLALGERTIPLVPGSGDERVAELTIDRSADASIDLTDADGFSSPSPERFSLTAVPDQPPQVTILEPGQDLSLAPSEITTIPLKILVSDDYAVAWAKLHITYTQRIEYEYQRTDETKALSLGEAPVRKATVDYAWPLGRRSLNAGDTVTYYVEAGDEFPTAKDAPPHTGSSRTYTIRIPITAQVVKEVDKEETEEIQSAEDLAHRQKALEENVDRVVRDWGASRDADYKSRKELEGIVSKQKDISQRAQELSARMAQTLDQIRRHDLVDPGTLQKLTQIQSLFQDVADSKMKEMMERLRTMMGTMKIDREQMEKMVSQFDKNRYSQELDRLAKALRRLKAQKDLSSAISQAQALAKQQDDLRAKTAAQTQEAQNASATDKQKEALAKRQDVLTKQQNALTRSAKDLLDGVEKLGRDMKSEFPDAAQRVSDAASEARRDGLEQSSKDAEKALQSGENSKAYAKQSQVSSKAQQLVQKLSAEQEGMQKKQIDLDMAAVTRLIEGGLEVAGVQGDVISKAARIQTMRDMRPLGLALAAGEYTVSRGSRQIERDLSDAFPDEVAFKGSFLSHTAEMIEEMDDAKKNYEQMRLYLGKQLSSRAMARLNVMLLKLVELMGALQDQQSAQGAGSFFDQLQKMIEQQRKLNAQSQRLKPDSAPNPFLMQMMQQMAAEQEVLRESLEQLAKKYDSAKNLLGDLQSIAKDMKDVQEALKKFDRSDEVKQKQQGILTHMLEAAQSIHKEGESRRRRAQTAKAFTPLRPPTLPTAITDEQKRLSENLAREGFPPSYQRLVEEYFSSFGP